MDNLGTRVIANEYEYSTSSVKYKVEFHGTRRFQSLNQAELLAQEEEKNKRDKEAEKQKQLEEGINKMKENLKLKNQKLKETKKLEEEKKSEKEEKKRKISEYSATLQSKIKNKLNSSKSTILDANISNISNINPTSNLKANHNEPIKPQQTNNFRNTNLSKLDNDEIPGENQWTLADNTDPNYVNVTNSNNINTVNLRDDIETMIRSQLINKCLKAKDLKQQQCEDEEEKNDSELDKLRQFRKYGKVETVKNTELVDNTLINSKKTDDMNLDEKIANERQSKQYLQFKKELEKRR
jgi:hypothetical protein